MTTTTAADPAVFDRAIRALNDHGWGRRPGSDSWRRGGVLCLGYAIGIGLGQTFSDREWRESPEMAVLAQAAAARHPVSPVDPTYRRSDYETVYVVNDEHVVGKDEAIAILTDARALALGGKE